ncbi:MAG: DNA-directed RNA polymerase subunit alpha [Chlamydiia bacterium]|nr:DNA-directed RNA polymerase subunit alpha [Chlamydiia bacterium]
MSVKYHSFELPTTIKVEDAPEENRSRYIAEPFVKGFGHTVGNALRRIMLNAIEAPAIVSVIVEGIPHEYMSVDGIIEDMTHIVLNFKNARLRKLPMDDEPGSKETKVMKREINITQQMIDDNGGQYAFTIGELVGDSDFEVVNPDLVLFNATQPQKRQVALKVAHGRGYLPSEAHANVEKIVDEIYIDACFSPVVLVNYFVEDCRVGGDTDFDKVILDITTDGRVTPQEVLSFATQIGILHFSAFDELKFQNITFDTEEEETSSDKDALLSKLGLKINEIELSVRSTNCLAQAQIDTIAQLVVMPESDMLKFRNFGKKSLNEIKAKLEEMGLYLGMDLSKYGITRDNVKEVISELTNEMAGKE